MSASLRRLHAGQRFSSIHDVEMVSKYPLRSASTTSVYPRFRTMHLPDCVVCTSLRSISVLFVCQSASKMLNTMTAAICATRSLMVGIPSALSSHPLWECGPSAPLAVGRFVRSSCANCSSHASTPLDSMPTNFAHRLQSSLICTTAAPGLFKHVLSVDLIIQRIER